MENIDEVEQIILLTTCTSKLHRYIGLLYIFYIFSKKVFPKFHPPILYPQTLLLPAQEYLRLTMSDFYIILQFLATESAIK